MDTALLWQLLIILLTSCLVLVNGQCSKQGELYTEKEWYDDILSAEFESGAVVDLEYEVTYSKQDSKTNPIKLILYVQQQKPVWNETTTCEQKIEMKSTIKQVIALNQSRYWAGCNHVDNNNIKCEGGRSFGHADKATYVIAVARCKSHNIQMKYKVTFDGYEKGSCLENPATSTKNPEKPGISTELLVVLIITVFNSVMIILAIVYAICRRYRLASRSSGQALSMNNMLFDRD